MKTRVALCGYGPEELLKVQSGVERSLQFAEVDFDEAFETKPGADGVGPHTEINVLSERDSYLILEALKVNRVYEPVSIVGAIDLILTAGDFMNGGWAEKWAALTIGAKRDRDS